MSKVKIYTDGSCHQVGSPTGKGGFGTILIYEDREVELSGYFPVTTNNRMELFAAIAGMEALKEPHEVELYSDSAYMVNCFKEKWFTKWIKNGWKNSKGEDVANKDLWIRLMSSLRGHKVQFLKVKGHSDDYYNNKCDEIAARAVKNEAI